MGQREELTARCARQVRADRVVPACRQDIHQWREHEENPGEGCDTAGRVADDRADARPKRPQHQVDRGAEHGACDARVPEAISGCGAGRRSPRSRRRSDGRYHEREGRRREDPTLAHKTGRRFGTAVNVARIIPVEYSPVITRTPSTPNASWATRRRRAQRRGMPVGPLRGLIGQCYETTAAKSGNADRQHAAPTATSASTEASGVSSTPSGRRVSG